ncbi:MAG: CPBP family intramembrane glutamic endopeptidase, partial [Thermoguttaceae bacterium]
PSLDESYWMRSREPLTSLVFIAPLLVVYEVGVLMLGPNAVRNGADVWLRQFFELAGFGQYFLLPILCVCILLGWHYTTRQPWDVSGRVLQSMACECIILALVLRVILHIQSSFFDPSLFVPEEATAASLSIGGEETFRRLVGFLGAGVYEELLFRLILLSSMAWFLRQMDATPSLSFVIAAVGTSLFFSVAHYLGTHAEPLEWQSQWFWFTFLFRWLAGMFFSMLFVLRGFGVVAGTHAVYDILVGLF